MDPVTAITSGYALYQLLQSIKELVDFGLAVKDAPPKITAVFNDLSLLADAIGRVQKASNVVEFDETTKRVLQDCWGKVWSLLHKFERASNQLKSTSKRRRTWQALKSTLETDETNSLRQDIEAIKSTLQLVLVSISLESTASIKRSQEEVLTEVRSFSTSFRQFEIDMRDPRLTSAVMKPGDLRHTITYALEKSASLDTAGDLVETAQATKDPVSDYIPTIMSLSQRMKVKTRTCQTQRSRNIIMPTFRVQVVSRTYDTKATRETKTIETSDTETETECIITPNALGRLLGVSYGMVLKSCSMTGWKYSIEPFRAVADTELIFEFCKKNNLDGVRTLLERGDASPWDRDSKGRTPLWFAAANLHLELAQLLLDQGADPHASNWGGGGIPIFAAITNKEINIRPKLAMITLLQSRSAREYSDETYLHMIGYSMFAYCPQKSIPMKWSQRRDAVYQVLSAILPCFHPRHPLLATILHGSLFFFCEGNILRCILGSIEGSIDTLDEKAVNSVVYEGLVRRLLERDRDSMKEIMKRTKNLHSVVKNMEWSSGKGRSDLKIQSPTMLALYDMDTFLEWRQVLWELGFDMTLFVEDEFREAGAFLQDAGWDRESLGWMFDRNLNVARGLGKHNSKVWASFPACERCGDEGTKVTTPLKVDLAWRRRLRDIRLRRFEMSKLTFGEVQSKGSIGIFIEIGQDNIGRTKRGVSVAVQEIIAEEPALPYRIVCPRACRDGVCVAWAFEGDGEDGDELIFPSYPQEPEVEEDGKNRFAKNEDLENLSTKSMPGAFVE